MWHCIYIFMVAHHIDDKIYFGIDKEKKIEGAVHTLLYEICGLMSK